MKQLPNAAIFIFALGILLVVLGKINKDPTSVMLGTFLMGFSLYQLIKNNP